VKAVITGGAGFIGSHIARRLDQLGWSVVAIDDLSGGRRSNVPASCALDILDVSAVEAVDRIARHAPDVVIHAAAQVSVARSMADPEEDWRVNVVGMKRVIEAAKLAKSRVVFLSSGGAIYGDSDGATETSPPAPRSYYAVHKYVAERYLELSGLSHAIARIGNVYGPRQRADQEGGVVAIFVKALKAHATITVHGTGKQRRDFIHVSDVADAIVTLANTDRSGTWNVATGTSVSINELLSALQDAIGPARDIVMAPVRPGDLFTSRLSVDLIKQDFNWSPKVDLSAGVRLLDDRGGGVA
jgi:UDP-glucose 4-epimerase